MKTYSISELFNLTRYQLFALHDGIIAELAPLPEGDALRAVGLANLRRIRRVLAHSRLSP